MATQKLLEQIQRAFEEHRDEAGVLRFTTVESGAHCGVDRDGRWVLVPEGGGAPVVFDPGSGHLFSVVLETRRRLFDDQLEEGARRFGLPVDDLLVAFPSIELIRSVLAKEHPYMTRLALEWAAPTELRELRREIHAVSQQRSMPVAVRELAERLTVPV